MSSLDLIQVHEFIFLETVKVYTSENAYLKRPVYIIY
jgi:hypothetical protein